MEILSRKNEKIKNIKLLNIKKYRDRFKKYYLEGVKVVNEVLDLNIEYETILYSKEILENVKGGNELLKRIHCLNNTISTSSDVFKFIADSKTPQGVLIVLNIKENNLNDLDLNKDVLMLDKVSDSGNVGTLIRTCNAFNVRNIICIKGTADVYNPKVLRSTMASILSVNVVYVEDIDECFKFLKDNNYNVISLSLDTNNYNVKDVLKTKNVIVLGNEANGISEEIIKKSDKLLKIPIEKTCESLNVAISGGIILNELYNKNK